MYVIKFDNGLYWCGYNQADKQLRKAIIYKTLKTAEAAVSDCMLRIKGISPCNLMQEVSSYKIIEVEIKEVK